MAEQRKVIAGDAVIEEGDVELAQVLPEPGAVEVTIAREFQEGARLWHEPAAPYAEKTTPKIASNAVFGG